MVIERPQPKRHPDSIVFSDVSWELYRAMLREYDELPSRINFDRGVLEVMTLSIQHEHYKSVLGLMLGQIALVFRIPIVHGGSSTLKRKKVRRGLEADQCYWIQHESVMRPKMRIDLRNDPPPDLVIEVDVMHAVVDREAIYAKLGVPEMWMLSRQKKLSAFQLVDKKWAKIEQSIAFPFLKVDDLNPFVARIGRDDDTTILADFHDWLRSIRL